MSYLYFPGCSLKSSGRGYEESLLAVCAALDLPVEELKDWNCCGATAYMSVSEMKAFALSGRNLALAERQQAQAGTIDLMVPCAACYLGLNKAQRYIREYADIRSQVGQALSAAGLSYSGRVRVRHPLDIFVNDVGVEKLTARVRQPLKGLKIACYYGCQLIRPYAEFDDQHVPTTMETIMKALGAEPIDWPLKTRCCGGTLIGTVPDVGMRLSYLIVKEAQKRGADLLVTACPLCQFNLECYQSKMNRKFEQAVDLPVVYVTQAMGMAFGLPQRQLGLQRLFVPVREARAAAAVAGGGSHG